MLLVANAQAKEAQAAAKAEQAAGVSALTEGLVKHISSFDIQSFIFLLHQISYLYQLLRDDRNSKSRLSDCRKFGLPISWHRAC